ncbi:DUF3037 domain-containing protein [Pacificimonas flava]|uniref:DUF3037 domain-containing protein n=1 Tax=Pacificimonas flava TaxID=1234595 RepID=UPI00098E9D0C|nr:DUF3037 domain-containing protein [Pacificimonas flava]MBB5281066.1 hypothetical protein [Pacificimonas flava]
MKNIFKYSIIRFRPFAETEEFANIGVVVIDGMSGKIDFQLAPKRFSRVRHFFEERAYNAYGHAIDLLKIELPRAGEYLPAIHGTDTRTTFWEIVRPRESSVIFSAPRALQSELPLDVLVRSLFARFVKREITVDNAEHVLTKKIRQALHRSHFKHFRTVKIEDDVIPVTFPLAYKGETLRAIKPLSFSQRSPMSVVDYGAHWRKRLSYVLDRGSVEKGNILIAVDGPEYDADDSMQEAYRLAIGELEQLPFQIVPSEMNGFVNPNIIEFAAHSPPSQKRFLQ